MRREMFVMGAGWLLRPTYLCARVREMTILRALTVLPKVPAVVAV